MKFIYHKDCADGFCCAFLFWLAYGEKGIDYLPMAYGDWLLDLKWDKDELVVIADFSFPAAVLNQLAKMVDRVIVFDHHKTAIEALERQTFETNIELHLVEGKCGARLLYEWLLDSTKAISIKVKMLVDYIEDRDLWKWEVDNSREVSAAIASYPKDFGIWASFDVEILAAEGVAILRYQKQLVTLICKNAHTTEGVASVNSCMLQSEVGEELGREADYADVWWENAAGEVVHSLRSRPDGVDVSEIAKSHGGGGHKHAAGYKEPA